MKMDLHSMGKAFKSSLKGSLKNSLDKFKGEKKNPDQWEASLSKPGKQDKYPPVMKTEHRPLHDFSTYLRSLEHKLHTLKEITEKWQKRNNAK